MVSPLRGCPSPSFGCSRLTCLVRILSCHYLPSLLTKCSPRYDDWGNWVLELESPLLLYSGLLIALCHKYRLLSCQFSAAPFDFSTGRLGHLNNDATNIATVQLALGACLAREAALQDLSLQLRSQQQPHPAFRFRMLFSDFMSLFRY